MPNVILKRQPVTPSGAAKAVFLATISTVTTLWCPTASAQSAPKQQHVFNNKDTGDIVVTATKRNTRLREVAGSVTAVTGDQLQALGAQSNADYLGRQPGVVFNEGTSGQSTVIIRGIGATAGIDQGQGPTGYFLNDIPLTEPSYSTGIPDVDTFDLDRVEVLRGPQGTLFGSASLGGAVNYIVKTADPSKIDAALQGSVASIDHSAGQATWSGKAMLNMPIVKDKLAARLVGYKRFDAGYIDNLGTGEKGSSDFHEEGLRGSVVYTPSDWTKISFLGLYQKNRVDDFQTAQSYIGPYAHSTINDAPSDYRFQIYSLRLDQKLSFAQLTVIGSINNKSHDLFSDTSRTSSVRTFVPHGVLSEELAHSNTKTAEARLASTVKGAFSWLVGAMYSHTDATISSISIAPSGASALAARYPSVELKGDIFNVGTSYRTSSEKALFGEANLRFLRDFTFTVGGRLFDDRYSIYIQRNGISYGLTGQYIAPTSSHDSGFVPKFSLSYKPNSDVTVYALASKGFRMGNPNTLQPVAGFNTPTQWSSDSLWNYELGTHMRALNGLLQLDAAMYDIEWSNIQVRLVRPVDNMTYGTNAGAARIRGLEVGGTIRPVTGLSLNTNFTYLDAKLTETVTTASPALLAGTQLPGASKWQVANVLTFQFPGPHNPTLTISHRYLSSAPETLQAPNVKVAGYNQFDLRAAIDLGHLNLALFGTNLTNKRAVSFGYGLSSGGTGLSEFIIRPRTVGISANWKL